MEVTLIDSKRNKRYDRVLTELNHLFHYCFVSPYRESQSPFIRLLDIYKSTGVFEHWFYNKIIDHTFIVQEQDITARGISHRIRQWFDSQTTTRADIVIYREDDDIIAWEPRLEQLLRIELLSNIVSPLIDESVIPLLGHTPYAWGYVDGRGTHIGRFMGRTGLLSANTSPGYEIWQECAITVEGLDLAKLIYNKSSENARV